MASSARVSFGTCSFLSRSTELSDATLDLMPVIKPSPMRFLKMRLKAAKERPAAAVVEARIGGRWRAAMLLSCADDMGFFFRVAGRWSTDGPVTLPYWLIRPTGRHVARRRPVPSSSLETPLHGRVKKATPEELRAMEEEEEEEPSERAPASSVGGNSVDLADYDSDATTIFDSYDLVPFKASSIYSLCN